MFVTFQLDIGASLRQILLFTGSISENPTKPGQYTSTGIITQKNSNTLEITELPIGRWTDDMKKVLSTLVNNNTIKGYREHHTEESVHFVVNMTRNKMMEISPHFEKVFKLEEKINTTNMHLFNAQGKRPVVCFGCFLCCF